MKYQWRASAGTVHRYPHRYALFFLTPSRFNLYKRRKESLFYRDIGHNGAVCDPEFGYITEG